MVEVELQGNLVRNIKPAAAQVGANWIPVLAPAFIDLQLYFFIHLIFRINYNLHRRNDLFQNIYTYAYGLLHFIIIDIHKNITFCLSFLSFILKRIL